MPKTIKLEDPIYHALDEVRGKRETFSQAVEHLLQTRRNVEELLGKLGPIRPDPRPPAEDTEQ